MKTLWTQRKTWQNYTSFQDQSVKNQTCGSNHWKCGWHHQELGSCKTYNDGKSKRKYGCQWMKTKGSGNNEWTRRRIPFHFPNLYILPMLIECTHSVSLLLVISIQEISRAFWLKPLGFRWTADLANHAQCTALHKPSFLGCPAAVKTREIIGSVVIVGNPVLRRILIQLILWAAIYHDVFLIIYKCSSLRRGCVHWSGFNSDTNWRQWPSHLTHFRSRDLRCLPWHRG